MSKSKVDDLIRVANAFIDEHERLVNLVAVQAKDIDRLRGALAIVHGDKDFEKRKAHVLATTGEQPFLWASQDGAMPEVEEDKI